VEDYKTRSYLSAVEAARFLGLTVALVHNLAKKGRLPFRRAASGQMRFRLDDLKGYLKSMRKTKKASSRLPVETIFDIAGTTQKIYPKNSQQMSELADNSVHLMITSPPYFNAKMYSSEPIEGDLGNIHDTETWFSEISKVWAEVFRVLQPGRKAFINIMNLPVRLENGFRALNLVGRTIDICESIGFIFKRDIVWQKTNSVRAHFGTYPYPGGILINNTHEFILEFEKPAPKGYPKYAHLTKEQKEASRLDKTFWIEVKKSDVWVMKPQGSGDRRSHVAPFPYELPYRLIKAYSYVGETVLDPFLGSGTTLLAAADLGRNGIGYEINPAIAEDAIKALKNHQPCLWR
jgi:excisionase family DNA binding protein